MPEVLDLTAREAFGFFRGQKKVQERLKVMIDVGLEYLRLGQPLSTLSGGEAQRLKLASYLGPRKSRRSLFIFEEPTIGLHPADVETFVACLDALIDVGHSVIAIDHDIELLIWADHIVELGPGAAGAGGRIIAEGSPSAVAKLDTPTGRRLRDVFNPA
jgi:excinuclease ABC subunit A